MAQLKALINKSAASVALGIYVLEKSRGVGPPRNSIFAVRGKWKIWSVKVIPESLADDWRGELRENCEAIKLSQSFTFSAGMWIC